MGLGRHGQPGPARYAIAVGGAPLPRRACSHAQSLMHCCERRCACRAVLQHVAPSLHHFVPLLHRRCTCFIRRVPDALGRRRTTAGCTAGRARVSAASRPEERYLDGPPRRLNHLGAVGVWRLGGRRALHAEQRWPYDAPAPDSECERLHRTRELQRTREGHARCE